MTYQKEVGQKLINKWIAKLAGDRFLALLNSAKFPCMVSEKISDYIWRDLRQTAVFVSNIIKFLVKDQMGQYKHLPDLVYNKIFHYLMEQYVFDYNLEYAGVIKQIPGTYNYYTKPTWISSRKELNYCNENCHDFCKEYVYNNYCTLKMNEYKYVINFSCESKKIYKKKYGFENNKKQLGSKEFKKDLYETLLKIPFILKLEHSERILLEDRFKNLEKIKIFTTNYNVLRIFSGMGNITYSV
tara:strand:- start:2337 stop:3062 length:726 start_codon:yes stop_codon:yes gene_type:complete